MTDYLHATQLLLKIQINLKVNATWARFRTSYPDTFKFTITINDYDLHSQAIASSSGKLKNLDVPTSRHVSRSSKYTNLVTKTMYDIWIRIFPVLLYSALM